MNGVSFDPARWDHWLLIGCFVGLSIWGLHLSWQWRRAARLKRQQARLARRLAMELHGSHRSSLTPQRPFYENSSAGQSIGARTESR